jgi:thiamine pyrophosphokinase
MNIGIIASGDFDDTIQNINIDMVICADGGANHTYRMGIVPEYIIGDLDSIRHEVLMYYKQQGVKIINDRDQSKTDTELALTFALTHNPSQITFFCANGTRTDHFLANIIAMSNIIPAKCNTSDLQMLGKKDWRNIPKLVIIDRYCVMHIVLDSIELTHMKGKTVSVLPLEQVKGLTYQGMKWNVENLDTQPGWIGVSNIAVKDTCTISLRSGKILVIIPDSQYQPTKILKGDCHSELH